MKKSLTIFAATALATTLATSALAGPVGISRNYPAVQPDQTTISDLEYASQRADRDASQHRNNLSFQRKSYEIDQLIERIKSGQQVDQSEIDKALEPAHVW